jgi:hypothetical protein
LAQPVKHWKATDLPFSETTLRSDKWLWSPEVIPGGPADSAGVRPMRGGLVHIIFDFQTCQSDRFEDWIGLAK